MTDHPITISQETYRHLVNLPFAQNAANSATMNPDGTVTFPISERNLHYLQSLHTDPDMAIQILLGLKTN